MLQGGRWLLASEGPRRRVSYAELGMFCAKYFGPLFWGFIRVTPIERDDAWCARVLGVYHHSSTAAPRRVFFKRG